MTVERTLDDGGGFPYSRLRAVLHTARRSAATALALASLVIALAAVADAVNGFAEAGVSTGADGTTVTWVLPTGFAWAGGIRPGQPILHVGDSRAPGGWDFTTDGGGRAITVNDTIPNQRLRGTMAVDVAAVVLAALSILFLGWRRAWSPSLACFSLLLAAPGMMFSGQAEVPTAALGLSALAPAVWLAWRPRFPLLVSAGLSLVAIGLVGLWAMARLTPFDAFPQLEAIRAQWAFIGAVLLVVGSVGLPALRGEPLSLSRPRVGDLALLGAAAGVGVGTLMLVGTSLVNLVAVVVIALLALPAWRRVVAARADRVFLADVREHAALEASEAERAHLARELHDAPLQQLAGIMRRLEVMPGTSEEVQELRDVAAQLRAVATELRPPVLDDLGLAAAIEFVAEKETTAALPIAVSVVDDTGLDPAARPPSDVELALFRIVQEAVSNAVRHSGARSIRIEGAVGPRHADVSVTDDGRGIDDAEVRSAARRGRLGMSSIRRRAAAIDADLTIDGSERGTRVRVRWDA